MIDHKTCEHINHTTLDGSRHEEIHTAIYNLLRDWHSRANQARAVDPEDGIADTLELAAEDLAHALHPFEVEQ